MDKLYETLSFMNDGDEIDAVLIDDKKNKIEALNKIYPYYVDEDGNMTLDNAKIIKEWLLEEIQKREDDKDVKEKTSQLLEKAWKLKKVDGTTNTISQAVLNEIFGVVEADIIQKVTNKLILKATLNNVEKGFTDAASKIKNTVDAKTKNLSEHLKGTFPEAAAKFEETTDKISEIKGNAKNWIAKQELESKSKQVVHNAKKKTHDTYIYLVARPEVEKTKAFLNDAKGKTGEAVDSLAKSFKFISEKFKNKKDYPNNNEKNDHKTYIHSEKLLLNVQPWFKVDEINDTTSYVESNNFNPSFPRNYETNWSSSAMVMIPVVSTIVGIFVGAYLYKKFVKNFFSKTNSSNIKNLSKKKQRKQAQEEQACYD